jgi:uncharacterized RDD family membrane protein YckC
MARSRSPVDRVFGAVMPRAVGAVDPDELLARIDVNQLLERLDVDAVVQRIDAEGLMGRIDVDALVARVDVDGLVARVDVEALVGRVDVEGLMGRIEVDALLARIDVNALLGRIDVNALMERIDVDALMSRVDVNALMGRVDLDALLAGVDVRQVVARAGIDEIVAEATTGIATRTLDLARRQVLGIDVVLLGLVDRLLGRGRAAAPDPDAPRPAGPVARLLAFLVDSFVVSVAFSAVVFLGGALFGLFTGRSVDVVENGGPWWAAAYLGWWFLYLWLGTLLAGRTVGKGLVGLRVVRRDGRGVGAGAAAVRVVVLPVSMVLGLGLIPAVVGRSRRALHDYAATTQVLVDWGARQAQLPGFLAEWLSEREA